MLRRVALLVALILAACGSKDDPLERPALAWVRDASKSLEQLLAEFYERYDTGYDRALVRERVAKIATTLREGLLKPDDSEQRRGMAIGVYLLTGDERLHFRKNAEGPSFRPDLVLEGGHGNCLGLATVFLLVAEELGVNASAVLRPHPLHVLVDCGGDLFDLRESGFKPVSRPQRLLWSEVGSSRRFGANLSRSQVVALHAITVAGLEVADRREHARSAWELYRLAAAVDPEGAAAQFGLAVAACVDGEERQALEHVSRSVELNPLSAAAQLFKSELEGLRGNRVAADLARRRAEEILGKQLSETAPMPE